MSALSFAALNDQASELLKIDPEPYNPNTQKHRDVLRVDLVLSAIGVGSDLRCMELG